MWSCVVDRMSQNPHCRLQPPRRPQSAPGGTRIRWTTALPGPYPGGSPGLLSMLSSWVAAVQALSRPSRWCYLDLSDEETKAWVESCRFALQSRSLPEYNKLPTDNSVNSQKISENVMIRILIHIFSWQCFCWSLSFYNFLICTVSSNKNKLLSLYEVISYQLFKCLESTCNYVAIQSHSEYWK